MARPKQLIGLNALTLGNKLLDQGVPMTKVHAKLQLTWHYASTRDIFMADRKNRFSATRPKWLQEEPTLQTPPDGWTFEGIFPDGRWVRTNV